MDTAVMQISARKTLITVALNPLEDLQTRKKLHSLAILNILTKYPSKIPTFVFLQSKNSPLTSITNQISSKENLILILKIDPTTI